jgi:hypothetical protein
MLSFDVNMPPAFGDRLWSVRSRVLAFCAVFLSAAALGALLVWYVSEAEADPGPVVYAFPVLFAILIGTFPVLAYYLTRWVNRFDVANCPTCDHFIWPTTIQAVQVALIPRCPHCLKRLGKVGNEE